MTQGKAQMAEITKQRLDGGNHKAAAQMAEMLFLAVHGGTGASCIPWGCSPLPWQKPWNNNWNRKIRLFQQLR